MAIINGTPAGEPLNGTAGNDTITGAGGADTIAMAGGSDLSLWSLGDGSDTVEGGTGSDTARFSSGGGLFNVAAGTGRVFVSAGTGGAGGDTVTLNDVERLDLRASAFYNTVTVGDLSGTDVTKVTVDFAGANDVATAYASSANNALSVTAAGTTINVAGLPTLFSITHADASDTVEVHGAGGNDKLAGSALGAGRIHLGLYGDDGNDFITGSINDDGLYGGTGNDTIIGGRGADTVFLGAGNDLYLWTAGDGSDTIDGEGDVDTVRATGSNDNESFSIFASGGKANLTRFLGISPSIFNLDEIERIEVRTLGGTDLVAVGKMTGTGVTSIAIDLAATAGGKTADTKVDIVDIGPENSNDSYVVTTVGSKIMVSGLDTELSIDHAGKTDVLRITGGLGNDLIDASALAAGRFTLELLGNSGNDTIYGSAGNDKVVEAGGDDQLFLGAGNDIVEWNGSAGDDLIEGGSGFDSFLLSANGYAVTIAANSGRALLTRSDGASIDMDDVERIQFSAHSMAGSFTVGDLTGAGIQQVALDVGDFSGKSGNGVVDSIGINATEGNDTIGATISKGIISVTGLASQLTIARAENSDVLIINGLGGDDVINMSKLPATTLATSPRGGAGNDTMVGGANNDLLFGQDGNDRLTGAAGNDSINPGPGDDLIIWNHGDGSDNIFDEGGTDTLRFTGSAANELIQLAFLSSSHFTLSRNVGAVLLPATNVERVEIATLGGADTIDIGDLSSAGVTAVAIDLAATVGGKAADAVVDTVSIQGTGASNNILLSLAGSKLVEVGLPTEVSIDHFGKTDRLVIHGGNSGDTIDASAVPAAKISLQLLGDDGNDLIFGSAGGDIVEGGTGNDTAILGAGNDTFNWFEFDGNDLIADQGGTDTFKVFGNGSEQNFALSTTTGRLIFSSAIDSATVDLDNVERVDIQAGQGIDLVTVHNLAGSDTKLVAIDLGSIGGTKGDGQGDIVVADGTDAAETITIALAAGAVSVKGLAVPISIAHAEAVDTLTILANGGNDVVSATTPATSLQLSLDGGAGNDKLTGGSAGDRLLGGEGNDSLNGGAGADTITGGWGNDTVTASSGNDTVRYTSVLDGHDVVIGFDGNAAGGQDVLDLDFLFDNLGVAAADRAGRVSIVDKGASVEIAVDTNGDLSFDLHVATLKTADVITVGPDIFVGI
jgi:Ca2+-binding RTX toxin-like protein